MQRHIKIFQEERILQKAAFQFKNALYVYVICRCLFWLHQYDLFFGQNAVVYSAFKLSGNFKDAAFVLLNSHNIHLGYYFLAIATTLGIACLYFHQIRPFADFIIWLVFINLHYKLYAALTGGDYLVNQLLFFQIFLNLNFRTQNNTLTLLGNLLHNGAVIAIVLQICFVYFLSGLAKIIDFNWQQGDALQLIAQVEQFKLIGTPHQNTVSNAMLFILDYLVMFYQLLFPVLAFVKKIKKPFLLFGIAMHLYIMCIMGLFWFAAIMIISYLFFWPSSAHKK